ncbi:MAG TPA: hypothetical protein PLD59_09565 [Tepidisphaeraceae bacterium]|nr:hypothetical protein [Tepidisphaeraceae bacterium]
MTLADRSCRGLGFGLVIAALLLTGCRSSRPAATVQFRAVDASGLMEQPFQKAYFTRDAGGDYDIVLLEQAGDSTRNGKALASNVPLTHLLHIKVLWRAKTMIRADSASASNCSLRYTVLSGAEGTVSYDGVGFAAVYGGDEQVRVMLKNATLTPGATRGGLADPLGKATLTADFKAKLNSEAVKDLLSMARDATAERLNPPMRPPTP